MRASRGGIAVDLRAGDLDPPDRHVGSVGAQLQLDHQLELAQRRQLRAQALDGLRDQAFGVGG